MLGFTRDEVILALDVLYSAENGRVRAEDASMQELSALLNRLPIHAVEDRREIFRSASGVAILLMRFRVAQKTGINNQHIGTLFFEIDKEFEGREEELHEIACAIRRNEKAYALPYGSALETQDFPEGSLLGHLHRCIELRDGAKVEAKERCELCCIKPALCYHGADSILEKHLLVPPSELDYTKKYRADAFMTLCPNCHAVLHQHRPWLERYNCEEILR